VRRRKEADRRVTFEHLFRETRSDLLAYALRRSTDPEDAADLLAETYLIAWEKIDALPRGEQARLWLFGVMRNVLLRGVRRSASRQALAQRLATELQRASASPERAVDDETVAALHAAVNSLPPREQEIVMLTAWEGLTPREIATVLGTSANAVRIRLHRARVQLKRRLDPTALDLPSSGPPTLDSHASVARRVAGAEAHFRSRPS
jgi:RNA polymerase sigma factor (sigma-70 family)